MADTPRFRGELAAQKRTEGQLAILEAQKVADAEKRLQDQAHALQLARIKEESALKMEAIRLAQKAADDASKEQKRLQSEAKKAQLVALRQQVKDKKSEETSASKSVAEGDRKAKKAVIDLERSQRGAARKQEQELKAKAYKDDRDKEHKRQDQVNVGLLAQRDLLKGVAETLPDGIGKGLLSAINTVKTLHGMGGGALGIGGFAAGAMGVASVVGSIGSVIFSAAAAQKQLTIDGLNYQRQWGGTVEEAKQFARETKRVGAYLGEGGDEFTQQLLGWAKINEDTLHDAKGYVQMMQNAAEPQNMGLDNAVKMHQIFASMREQITKNPFGSSTVTLQQIRESFVGTGFQSMKVSEHAPQWAKDKSSGGLDAYDIAFQKVLGNKQPGQQITQKDLDNLQSTLLEITKNVDTPAEAVAEGPFEKLQRQFEEIAAGLMPKINDMAGGVLELVKHFTGKSETDTTMSEGGIAKWGDYMVAAMLPGFMEMDYGGKKVTAAQVMENYSNGQGVLHGSKDLKDAYDKFTPSVDSVAKKTEVNNNIGGITITVTSSDKDIPNAVVEGARQGTEAALANAHAAQGGPLP